MMTDHAPTFTNQRIPTLIQSELTRMLDAVETAPHETLASFEETLADWHIITTTTETTEIAIAAPFTKTITTRSRSLAERILHFFTSRGDWVSRDINRVEVESTPMFEVPMTLAVDPESFNLIQQDDLEGTRRRVTLMLMALKQALEPNGYTGIFKQHHAIGNANALGIWLDDTNAPGLSRHDLHIRNLRDVLGGIRFEVANGESA